MELIMAIATLCNVYSSAGPTMAQVQALTCQQYYVSCYDKKLERQGKNNNWRQPSFLILECIKEKK